MDAADDLPAAPSQRRQDVPVTPRGRMGGAICCTIFCAVLLGAGQVIAHLRSDDRDRWIYAYFGERVLAGDALYADLWDVKPPLNYWLNAVGLWLGGGSYYGVMACCAAVSALTLAALYSASRAFCGRGAALVATALGAVYLTHSYYFGGTNRSEPLEVLLELTAAAFYLRHLGRFSVWKVLVAGLACGLATGAKQTGVILFVAIAIDQLIRLVGFASQRRFAAAGLVVAVVGFGVGLAAWLAPAIRAAGGQAVYDALVGFHRLNLVSAGVNPLWPRSLNLAGQLRLLALPVILAAAAAIHALLNVPSVRQRMTGQRVTPDGHRGGGSIAFLVIWLVLCVYGIALAPHERPHYWLLVLGPLLLLSARSMDLLVGELSVLEAMRRKMSTTVAVVAGAYVLYQPLTIQLGELAQKWYYHLDALDPPVAGKIAEVIEADARPDDTVFVWGHSPDVVWRLHRPYPTRYVGTHFFELHGGLGQPLFDEMLAALQRARPGYLVLGSEPASLGAREADEYGLDVSGFVHLVTTAYAPWKTVAGNTIYRLRRIGA